MLKRIVIVAVVVLAVSGVLAAKLMRGDGSSSSSVDTASAGARVILVANLGEAGEQCGCGQMIEAARALRGHAGIAYEEHDTRQADGVAARLKLKEQPAIVILGADGAERARFEGEDAATIAAARQALQSLSAKGTT